MKLSIVIPCYNCSDNIINIINLLEIQVNDSVEVIFINDGSLDKTADIISENLHSRSLTNFYLYSYTNGGAAKARTRGLAKAVGEYVFFLDSDDVISKYFVRDILQAVKCHPDMIYFSSIIISSTSPYEKISNKLVFEKDMIFDDHDDFISFMFKNKNWTSAVWSYVFRRNLAITANAHFTNRIAHEDHVFSLRLVGNSKKIIVISDVLYMQKRTEGSLTTSKKDNSYVLERFIAFEESRDDMRNIYSSKSIALYEQWSIFSFIHLCLDNIKVIWAWVFIPRFYSNVWKYRSVIASLAISAISKKLKRKK